MQVAEAKRLGDPPLLRLERESSHAYLSMLLHARSNLPELSAEAKVEARLMQLCMQNLERFQVSCRASPFTVAECIEGCKLQKQPCSSRKLHHETAIKTLSDLCFNMTWFNLSTNCKPTATTHFKRLWTIHDPS